MINRIKLKAISALFLLLTISYQIQAGDLVAPQVLVQDTTNEMLKLLKENKAQLESNPNLIYGLVEEVIIPNFDFNKMAKLVLGKNWRKASQNQQARFTHEFKLLLIRTYSKAMLQYVDEKIHFLPFRGDVSKKKAKVTMEILQSGGPPIPMSIYLYLKEKKVWKVYDVKIDGISLVINYRSTFATKIRKSGIDTLIDSLAVKNAKAKGA